MEGKLRVLGFVLIFAFALPGTFSVAESVGKIRCVAICIAPIERHLYYGLMASSGPSREMAFEKLRPQCKQFAQMMSRGFGDEFELKMSTDLHIKNIEDAGIVDPQKYMDNMPDATAENSCYSLVPATK